MATGHTDGDWITDTNATCTADGSKHLVCSVCNATLETQSIDAKGHSHISVVTEPTHTNEGFTTFTCACGESYIDNYVDALGHNYVANTSPKTCAKDGYITYNCSCGDTYIENIAPITISFVFTGTSSSTINGYGNYTRHYDVGTTGGYGTIKFKYELYNSSTATAPVDTIDFTSGNVYSVSSKGYSFSAGNYVVKITAKDNYNNVSTYRFAISDAHLIDYEVIDEHTLGEWITDTAATCTLDGIKHQVCSVCTAAIKTEPIAATGHTDGEWITDTNATCTVDGSKHQECSVCSTSIKTETIAATGHTAGKWVTDTNATCTVDGSKHQVCTICKLTIATETISKEPHNFISDNDLTYLNTRGFDIYTCTVCEYQAYLDKNGLELELADLVLSTDGTTVMSCNNVDTAELLIIPDSVTSFEDDKIFVYCHSLKYVSFGEGLLKVNLQGAPIEHIYIPANITVILYDCDNLDTVIWADGIMNVDEFGIYSGYIGRELRFSTIQNIVIPVSVSKIKEGVFWHTELTTVYYMGTAEDWNDIDIEDEQNEGLLNAARYYYSETEPIESGNYWHYVDGVPTVW